MMKKKSLSLRKRNNMSNKNMMILKMNWKLNRIKMRNTRKKRLNKMKRPKKSLKFQNQII
jgi:hypothetical protein